jgi:hypothetical protein
MAGGPSDCGAQFATTRGGWVVAKLCGDHKIIVSAATRQAADQAARVRAVALNRLHVCKRVLTVGPNGVVLPAQAETDEQGATGADPDQAQSATGRFVPRFDIGALTAESDFTLFMRKEVPDDVRLLTLRRLWVLMRLPVSCHELYFERERAESDLSQLTGEKLIAAAE